MKEQNEKQAIEEMVEIIEQAKRDMWEGKADPGVDFESHSRNVAKAIYNAEYRKQSEGEWKWISDDDCICSACGKVFYSADNADAGTVLWNFCPNCGARMKGGEE